MAHVTTSNIISNEKFITNSMENNDEPPLKTIELNHKPNTLCYYADQKGYGYDYIFAASSNNPKMTFLRIDPVNYSINKNDCIYVKSKAITSDAKFLDNDKLCICTTNGQLKILEFGNDIKETNLACLGSNHSSNYYSLSVIHETCFIGSNDGSLKYLSLKRPDVVSLYNDTFSINKVCHFNQFMVSTINTFGFINIFDTRNNNHLPSQTLKQNDKILYGCSLAVNPACNYYLISTNSSGIILHWDTRKSDMPFKIIDAQETTGDINNVQFNIFQPNIVSCTSLEGYFLKYDHTVEDQYGYDKKDLDFYRNIQMKMYKYPILSLDVSKSGLFSVFGLANNTIKLISS